MEAIGKKIKRLRTEKKLKQISLIEYNPSQVSQIESGKIKNPTESTLQVIAQQHAKSSHAAIILGLEGAFAVLGGWLILDENLSTRGLIGCALMLTGMFLSQLLPRLSFKKRLSE